MNRNSINLATSFYLSRLGLCTIRSAFGQSYQQEGTKNASVLVIYSGMLSTLNFPKCTRHRPSNGSIDERHVPLAVIRVSDHIELLTCCLTGMNCSVAKRNLAEDTVLDEQPCYSEHKQ